MSSPLQLGRAIAAAFADDDLARAQLTQAIVRTMPADVQERRARIIQPSARQYPNAGASHTAGSSPECTEGTGKEGAVS